MIRSIKIFILLLAVLASATLSAQKTISGASAVVKADTLRRQIGQRVVLTINLRLPDTKKFLWPVISDTLGKLEVLSRTQVGTTKDADKHFKNYSQQLTVTSFETGDVTFPELQFKVSEGKDTTTLLSNSVSLQYATVEVDTTKSIKDIKNNMAAPLTAREVFPWLLAVLIAGALVIIGFTIYLRKKSKKPLILFKPKPEIPAHILAFEALDHLKAEAIWKNGKYKEYYTDLTDILRVYLEKRFGVMAQEMTSDEIMEALSRLTTDGLNSRLRLLFTTADLVKFAKGIPESNENEANLDVAYAFVETTKLVPVEESTPADPAKTTSPATQKPTN